MAEAEKTDTPDGFGAGLTFLLIIALTVVTGVAQLVIAKQYVILGLVLIIGAGFFTAFAVRAAHSPRAGENSEESE